MSELDLVRAAMNEIRNQYGFVTAKKIIEQVGGAERLSEVAEDRYDRLIEHAETMLFGRQRTVDRLHRAAERLTKAIHALNHAQAEGSTMTGPVDDLKAAAADAVTAMSNAATFIQRHPAAQTDPALADLATRLRTASQALNAVDIDSTVSSGGTVDAGGTVSSGGTVDSGGTVSSGGTVDSGGTVSSGGTVGA